MNMFLELYTGSVWFFSERYLISCLYTTLMRCKDSWRLPAKELNIHPSLVVTLNPKP